MKVSAIAVVIFAHGNEDDFIEFSDGRRMALRKLLQPLMFCDNLNGKPKLIITEVCRGTRNLAEQYYSDSDDESRLNNQVSRRTFYSSDQN